MKADVKAKVGWEWRRALLTVVSGDSQGSWGPGHSPEFFLAHGPLVDKLNLAD